MTVNYELNESVATITLDDGKVNVLSPTMQQNLNAALDAVDLPARVWLLRQHLRAARRLCRPAPRAR